MKSFFLFFILYTILATAYGITLASLTNANPSCGTGLQVGTILCIPSTSAPATNAPSSSCSGNYSPYTVVNGDSCNSIGNHYILNIYITMIFLDYQSNSIFYLY